MCSSRGALRSPCDAVWQPLLVVAGDANTDCKQAGCLGHGCGLIPILRPPSGSSAGTVFAKAGLRDGSRAVLRQLLHRCGRAHTSRSQQLVHDGLETVDLQERTGVGVKGRRGGSEPGGEVLWECGGVGKACLGVGWMGLHANVCWKRCMG